MQSKPGQIGMAEHSTMLYWDDLKLRLPLPIVISVISEEAMDVPKFAKVTQQQGQQNYILPSLRMSGGQGLPGSDDVDTKELEITVHTQHLPSSTSPTTAPPCYQINFFIHLRNSASCQKYSAAQVQWSPLGIGMQSPAFSFIWKALRVLGLLGSASPSSYYSRVLSIIGEGTAWKTAAITP